MVKSRSDLNVPNLRMFFDKKPYVFKAINQAFLTNIYSFVGGDFTHLSLRMPKVKSMTTEAIAARERRISDAETRRFNTTMKEFIEIKYDSIYEEYSTFYKALIEKHPRKKNLLKTSTFIEWKKRVIEESFEKDGVTVEVTNMIPPGDTESESEGEEGENLHERFSEQELPLDELESAERGELPVRRLGKCRAYN